MANISKHPEYHNPFYRFPDEQFRPIDELYHVSNYGRIMTYPRSYKRHHAWELMPQKVLVLGVNEFGYHSFAQFKSGRSVHRIVAQAFIPNPDNKPNINHKDNDSLNNHVSNLEWCTQSENLKHARDNGLLTVSKLDMDKATEIRLLFPHMKVDHLANKYGVSTSTIYKIAQNKIWV